MSDLSEPSGGGGGSSVSNATPGSLAAAAAFQNYSQPRIGANYNRLGASTTRRHSDDDATSAAGSILTGSVQHLTRDSSGTAVAAGTTPVLSAQGSYRHATTTPSTRAHPSDSITPSHHNSTSANGALSVPVSHNPSASGAAVTHPNNASSAEIEFDMRSIDEFRALHPRVSGVHGLALGSTTSQTPGAGDDDDTDEDDDETELQTRRKDNVTAVADATAAAVGADGTLGLISSKSTLSESLLPAQAIDHIVSDRSAGWFAEWDTLPERYLASVPQSYFAFFKAFVGAGILFLPKAFSSGGFATSIFTFAVVTWLATICMIRMTACKDRVVRDFKAGVNHGIKKTLKQITFGMIARVAYGRPGRWVIDGSIALSQLGFAGSALIFSSKNIEAVVLSMSKCDVHLDRAWIIAALVPFLVPFVWIRQLTRFATAILIADSLIVCGILYILIRNLVHISVHGIAPGVVQYNGLSGFFIFFGAALYALEGTAFVLPINLAMRDKSKSDSVITYSSIAVGALYCAFGAIGYLAYGSGALTVITLNLQEDYQHDVSVTVLQLGYVFALLLAYPVTLFPAIRIIEPKVFKSSAKSTSTTWKKNLFRTGLVIFTAGAAIGGADQFENFVGLIGGLACVPLTLLFPALFHLRLFGNELSKRERYENYLIIFVGTIGFLATSISSAYDWAVSTPSPPPQCIPL